MKSTLFISKFLIIKGFCGSQACFATTVMGQNYRNDRFCLLHVSDKKGFFVILAP